MVKPVLTMTIPKIQFKIVNPNLIMTISTPPDILFLTLLKYLLVLTIWPWPFNDKMVLWSWSKWSFWPLPFGKIRRFCAHVQTPPPNFSWIDKEGKQWQFHEFNSDGIMIQSLLKLANLQSLSVISFKMYRMYTCYVYSFSLFTRKLVYCTIQTLLYSLNLSQ
jgi:hypothetical protein